MTKASPARRAKRLPTATDQNLPQVTVKANKIFGVIRGKKPVEGKEEPEDVITVGMMNAVHQLSNMKVRGRKGIEVIRGIQEIQRAREATELAVKNAGGDQARIDEIMEGEITFNFPVIKLEDILDETSEFNPGVFLSLDWWIK